MTPLDHSKSWMSEAARMQPTIRMIRQRSSRVITPMRSRIVILVDRKLLCLSCSGSMRRSKGVSCMFTKQSLSQWLLLQNAVSKPFDSQVAH